MSEASQGFEIVDAETPEAVACVRELFAEYAASLGLSLCFQHFDRELAELPGAYALPTGRLLLAFEGDVPAACVGLRPISPSVCELKRLYVRSAYRDRGLGRHLTELVIDAAREFGYRRMVLDTLASMSAAQALYHTLGFEPIEPYYANPIEGAVFMQLVLDESP